MVIRTAWRAALGLLLVLATACSSEDEQAAVADLILHNGAIYTADPEQASVQALALRGDRILAVGSDEAVLELRDEDTRIIDLQGARVLPGLHDTHIHPSAILEYDACNIDSQPLDLEQLAEFVGDCIERLGVDEGEWFTVRQWNFAENNQPAGGLSNLRDALDRASGSTPIILFGNDGHHFATNSRGLEKASLPDGTRVGLTGSTLSEHFSELSSYVGVDAQGEPSGAVNEIVPDILGAPTLLSPNVAELIPHVAQIPQRLHSLGITSFQEAAFAPSLDPFYGALLDLGPLQLRIRLAQFLPPAAFAGKDGLVDMSALLAAAGKIRDKYAGVENIDASALKFFVDGVLEGNPLADPPSLPNAAQLEAFHHPRFTFDLEAGAATLTGYAEAEEDNRGVLANPRETALSFVQEADKAGFAVHMHAIGDRAVRTAVDAIEQVTPEGVAFNRHSMTHLQLVSDEEIERLGKLKIPLAFTFAWAARNFEYDVSVIPFVEELGSLDEMYQPDSYYYQHVYPTRSILEAGGILAAGSDAPVDTDDPRPFVNIQTAVTRDRGQGALNPGQAIGIRDAVDAYTINGARLMGQEALTGSLEVGKKADFIVLSQDIIAMAEAGEGSHLDQTVVIQTWFDGELVYQAKPPVPHTASALSLMQGSPPAVEQQVNLDNFMVYPYSRWAFQHIRELHPTREVYRGTGPVAQIVDRPVDLDALEFEVALGRKLDLAGWMAESATDSFLVLHRGELVYERYANSMQAHTQHQMFSATKSLIGTLVLVLAEEGLIDTGKLMVEYIPELEGSAFGEATVQQVLDMTTSITFNEDYTDPEADIWKYGSVFSIAGKVPEGYTGPRTIHSYLPTLTGAEREHGHGFLYVTPNTDALGWLLSRVTGKTVSQLLEEIIWQPLGVERDAYFWLDGSATEMASGGLSITARDAARFGQMILQKGVYNGRQIIPASVAERILQAGDPDTFTRLYDDPWYRNVGYAYHDQWWTFNNSHKAVSAIGVHGQFIYIDPVAEMVVVKQSSHPEAEGVSNEVDGPLIWQAIAEYLMEES